MYFLVAEDASETCTTQFQLHHPSGTPYLKKDNYTVQETLQLLWTIDEVEMPTSNPTTILTSILSGMWLGVDLRTNTKNIC